MTDGGPPTLGYAGPVRRPPTVRKFVAGTVVLAVVFYIVANVIESYTSDYLSAHDGVVGPLSLSEPEVEHIHHHGGLNCMIEMFWSVPATGVYAVGALLIRPRRGWRLGWPAGVVALAGALTYSWVRWGFDLERIKLGERADVAVAMLLAAVAGVVTGLARRWASEGAS